jgi:hypothetical protein
MALGGRLTGGYRVVFKTNSDYQMVWIRFIGTHPGYDTIKETKCKKMVIKPINTKTDMTLTRF